MNPNTYIITKLKKDKSERYILSEDLKTWLPLKSIKKSAIVDSVKAKELISELSVDDNYYYLKTSV